MKSILSAIALGCAVLAPAAYATEFSILLFETTSTLAQRTNPAQSPDYWNGYNKVASALTVEIKTHRPNPTMFQQ